MHWLEHGPVDWKIGTLIGFIRRAFTHSSNFKLVHHELQFLERQFLDVGYPARLLAAKIRDTTTRMVNPKAKAPEDEEKPFWCVCSLNWAGDDAHERVKRLRRELRGGQIQISISYKVQKLDTVLL